MIKINLVSEGRKPVVARKAREALGVGEVSRAELVLYGVLILGVLGIAGYWFYLRGEIQERDESIATAEEEVEALALVLQEVEDFKNKKAELEHKIDVINELKRNQWGPVRIMDQISRALPDLLWLESLQLRGNNVDLQGRAFNTNQIATLIENLNKVPEFQEPRMRQTALGGGTYSFTITFNFEFPEPEGDEEGDEAMAETAAGG